MIFQFQCQFDVSKEAGAVILLLCIQKYIHLVLDKGGEEKLRR